MEEIILTVQRDTGQLFKEHVHEEINHKKVQ